jgi:hypothetical protein
VRLFAIPIRCRLHQNVGTGFLLGGRAVTSLIFTVAKSLYSIVHHHVWFGSSKKINPGSSWNVFNPFSIYSPNQEYECMYGNFKYNHAITLMKVHNLGKEGQCEFWRIYQNFANTFESQINSNQVQKQFFFQNF